MNTSDTAAALALALPEAIGTEPRAGGLHRRDIGVIQANRLAEQGYRLVRPIDESDDDWSPEVSD